MRRYRAFGLLAASTAALAATMLSAVPSGQAAVLVAHKAPPAGRRLATLKGPAGFNARFGSQVAIAGSTAVVTESTTLSHTSVWVFSKVKSGWKQVAKLTGSGPSASTTNDEFGASVAVAGNTIGVGAPFYGGVTGNGRAYVYGKTASGGWKQTAVIGQTDGSATGSDQFGFAVAVSGNTIVASAPNHPHAGVFGAAYVFARSSSKWHQAAELDGTNQFGHSVAASGTTVVVGSPYDATGGGRVYVYGRTASGGWKRSATLKGSDTRGSSLPSGDHFGWSVSISGATIAVGAPQHASLSGRAYVFAKGKSWKQTAELKVSGGTGLGEQIAVAGKALLANDSLVAKPVFLFTKTARGWRQAKVLSPAGGTDGGDPSAPISISGALAFVGSPTGGGNFSGRAYVYEA